MVDMALRWDDFSGGDYGSVDSPKAEPNQYRATNMVVYDSGLIGPRAGLKALVLGGTPPTHTTAPGPQGFGVFGGNLLLVQDRIHQIPITAPTAVAQAVYPASATTPVRFAQANNVLYSLKSGVVYKHVGTGTTAATMPTGITFSQLVQWDQWLIGVDVATPYRIWFTFLDSGGPNFDSWPNTNYLYVGGNDTITALLPIFNTLYVGKASGWWAVSGVLGIQASSRAVALGNGPKDYRLAAATTDNRIAYWPGEDSPAVFNGESVRVLIEHDLRQTQTVPTSDGVIVTPTGQKIIMAGDATAATGGTHLYVYERGKWAYHTVPFAIGGMTPQDVRYGYAMPSGVIFVVNNPATIGTAVTIASWAHQTMRPAHLTDTWAAPIDTTATDLVSGSLELRSWYDGQGRQVRVRSVIVQFRKWASGVANSLNRINMNVTVHGQYEAGSTTGDVLQWYEPSERASATGVDDSWRANVGEQGYGNGFTITFPKIQGIAIREVIALVDIRTTKT